jgi:hypothetical protein
VESEPSANCDDFVTNRPEVADNARRAGAKQIIDTLVLSVMLSHP